MRKTLLVVAILISATMAGSIFLKRKPPPTSGEHLVFIGVRACVNSTGSNIICIGYEAGKQLTDESNMICLGQQCWSQLDDKPSYEFVDELLRYVRLELVGCEATGEK